MVGKIVLGLDRTIRALAAAGRWLALPIMLLLFLQWPLREGLGRWSREANDLGQCVFALYVAIAMTAATRAGRHLSADLIAHRYGDRLRRRLHAIAILTATLPWSAFVLWKAWRPVVMSIGGLERFQDTDDPGYFVVKAALLLLAAMVAIQGVLDLRRGAA
ncbi:TRAP transporter small permease subunit [Siculibacillus lacustris]|uniref:TRAP transporter small permease protein n=1 Tax=Siculibacillus lacustris TaxID=1549641 RepID=A0A4Q9VTR4_9HYPH|nr:TRAP transporter small permease subunit [Siculibacillus lacustris]TBW39009.1 TRAP transporter small permease subunit [Siculibacillus lacustris]